MANLFYSGLMVSDQIDAKLAGALVLDGEDNEVAVKDGALVVLGDLVEDQTYMASGDFEYNAYKAKAPAAGAWKKRCYSCCHCICAKPNHWELGIAGYG